MKDIFDHIKPFLNLLDRYLIEIVNFTIGFIIGGGITWINLTWQL